MKVQETANVEYNGKKLWQRPWSYLESFIISGTLILMGFLAELVFRDQPVSLPHFPANLIILFTFITILVLVQVFYSKNATVKWLSSIPCAISAVVSYAILVLLLGFISQEVEDPTPWMQQIGLTHLKNSRPFLVVEVYLFVSLGMVVLRRSSLSKRKNLGFLLNHFGLWLTLAAVALSSGDLQRLRLSVFENGDYLNKGITTRHEIYNLPFSVKLLDFKMETYNPRIVLSDTMGSIPERQKGETLPVIEMDSEYKLNHYSIKILNLLPSAARTDSGYVISDDPLAATAALVHVKNLNTGDSLTNWLCSGSLMMLREYILLEKNLGLWLLSPEPRKFESKIMFKTISGKEDTISIAVNKPYKTHGWSLYQTGYDERMGPASQLSIIEAVYDPWLPVVYAGIILMIAGAFYLFWLGRSARDSKE